MDLQNGNKYSIAVHMLQKMKEKELKAAAEAGTPEASEAAQQNAARFERVTESLIMASRMEEMKQSQNNNYK